MKQSLTILKDGQQNDAENYQKLRDEGINLLQELSGEVWTDYNIHDPGVTIWEILCYALTDLGYRSYFPIEDLLTKAGTTGPDYSEQFYKVHEILPVHPITIQDYRRLIIDLLPGIRNVWITAVTDEPYEPRIYVQDDKHALTLNDALAVVNKVNPLKLKGFYRIMLELEQEKIISGNVAKWVDYNNITEKYLSSLLGHESDVNFISQAKDQYKKAVAEVLLKHRNLCEDFISIDFATKETVAVCADIEVESDVDLAAVYLKIYEVLYNYITPSIPFYSIEELLAKGRSVEEIFEGPLYLDYYIDVPVGESPAEYLDEALTRKAFIDKDDLEKFDKRRVVVKSDIINLLMDIPGVIAVKKISLSSYDSLGNVLRDGVATQYCVSLTDPAHCFDFVMDCFSKKDDGRLNKIVLWKDVMPYYLPKEGLDRERYRKMVDLHVRDFSSINNLQFGILKGVNRDLKQYYPIQYDFPQAYLVGKEGISEQETNERKAQRLQLKAYLMFFEQLAANYCAQLNGINKLFSWASSDLRTYFTKELDGNVIKDADKVLLEYDSDLPAATKDKEREQYDLVFENKKTAAFRKNRFLDHMLARFNEDYEDISLLKTAYRVKQYISTLTAKQVAEDKVDFLKNYVRISRDRSHAFDYNALVADLWNTSENISGFELRVAKKLGLDNAGRKTLYKGHAFDYSYDEDFGFHVVEHILLRPRANSTDTNTGFLSLCCCDDNPEESDAAHFCDDPYSLRLTVVLPGWEIYKPLWKTYEQYISFRTFVEKSIREEAPAHVSLKICWLTMEKMELFETKYRNWLESLSTKVGESGEWLAAGDGPYFTALTEFIAVINDLENHYRGGHLHNCAYIEGNTEAASHRAVILNRTALASDEDVKTPVLDYLSDDTKDLDDDEEELPEVAEDETDD